MLSAKDIRNVKFGKALSGYSQEEVDILLDKVEADYEQFERLARELQAKIDELQVEIEGYKSTQNSIQNVLLSAQTLADQIVDDAKAKSEQIVCNAEASIESLAEREKELTAEIEKKCEERRLAAEKEIQEMLALAEQKRISIEKATADAVARQQLLFDRLKAEVSAFKVEVTGRYREHLEILQKLPEFVPADPTAISDAVIEAIKAAPSPEEYIDSSDISKKEEIKDSAVADKPHEKTASTDEKKADSGFVVAQINDEN